MLRHWAVIFALPAAVLLAGSLAAAPLTVLRRPDGARASIPAGDHDIFCAMAMGAADPVLEDAMEVPGGPFPLAATPEPTPGPQPKPEPEPETDEDGGSSGGCDAGLGGLAAIALVAGAAFVLRRRT